MDVPRLIPIDVENSKTIEDLIKAVVFHLMALP